jgi:guanylate kinase
MLYIISAPSGGGKTSLMKAVVSKMDNLVVSVSYTTRPPRPGEVDGVNYYFVDTQNFNQMLNQGDFLEYAEVFGSFYGTSKRWVDDQIQKNKDVILEIDWQGAAQIRKLYPESTSIFILPPSLDILYDRLKQRKQDSEAVIEKRMTAAKSECKHYQEFDYIVINNNFDTAVAEIESIILSTRLRCDIQSQKHRQLIGKILA